MLSSAGLIRSRPRATPPAIHIFGRPIFYSPKIRLLITLLSRCYRGAGHFLGCTQEEKRSRPSCLFFSSCPHLPLFIMGVARLAAWSGLDCLNLVKLLLLPTLTVPHPPVHSGTAQFQTRLVLWHRSSLSYVLARGEKHETKVCWTLACSIWILMWKILIKGGRVCVCRDDRVTRSGFQLHHRHLGWDSNKRGGGPDRFSSYEQREVEISLICQQRGSKVGSGCQNALG